MVKLLVNCLLDFLFCSLVSLSIFPSSIIIYILSIIQFCLSVFLVFKRFYDVLFYDASLFSVNIRYLKVSCPSNAADLYRMWTFEIHEQATRVLFSFTGLCNSMICVLYCSQYIIFLSTFSLVVCLCFLLI